MGLDSVALIVMIEKKFKIIIADREAEQIATVGQLYEVVQQKATGYDKEQVETMIQQILIDLIGVDLEDISPDKSLTDDLGID